MSTPILPFATWASGTNQNSIPANDNSLRNQILNGLVISQAVTAQPGSPTEGDIYIIAATHTGTQWATFTPKDLAIYSGGTWYAFAPVNGVTVNVAGLLYKYEAGAWAAVTTSFAGGALTTALNEAPAVTLASAGTVNIGAAAANSISVTGTTTITAFDSLAASAIRRLTFAGILTLTHNATSLILPTGANITTAAGDVAEFVSLGSGNWRCVNYMRASGNALVGSAFSGGTLTSALNEAPPATIASAATVNIGAAASNTVIVSGTTTITAFDTIAAGAIRRVRFSGALTLTYNATTLILPAAANITTAAGDVATMESLGSGNWRCVDYAKADGTALVAAGGGGLTNWTDAVNTATPNATIPVDSLTVSNAATNVDAAIVPKGIGGFALAVANNATAGGNKRGSRAVDLQISRANTAQVANGTESFIGGGLNNTASGSQSAVVAGNGNIASGQYSFAIGINSTASGTNAFASGNGSTASQNFAFTHGQTCTANQFYAVAMGNACTATANYGFSHGNSCVADGVSSRAGGEYAIARGAYGVQAYASGAFTAAGDAQVRKFTLRKATTDATATVLSADAGTATAANSIVLPTGSSYHFEAQVVARQATTGDSASWTVRGLAKNVAGTCSIVGTPSVVQDFADTGATTWALAITANNTLKSIAFGITGEAAKSLKWIADVRTVEVVG